MLTLYYSPNSPYVKKNIVEARELGLEHLIERTQMSTDPFAEEVANSHINPSGKVPTLVSKEGSPYFGSQAIGQYLDGISQGKKIIPSDPVARADEVTLETISDGILDASLLIQYERTKRAPEDKFWQKWVDGQLIKIRRALKALYQRLPEQEGKGAKLPKPDTAEPLSLGGVAAGCALWYLDKRLFDIIDWRNLGEEGKALGEWYAQVSKRPSFASPH